MAKPLLTDDDFCRAAKRIRCEVAAIKAVADTESRGQGFYADGFPVILYERHIFRKYTDGKFNKSHPELSGPQGNYGKPGANQRRKFSAAFELDPIAAMKACSWGKFQLMGFNWKVCGFSSVGDMIDAMKESEGRHLDGFVSFVKGNRLDDEIREKDWAGFAYGYNGKGYKVNKYDTKMAAAYKKFAKENIDCSNLSAASMPAPQEEQGELSPALADPQAVQPDQPPILTETTETVEIDEQGDASATIEKKETSFTPDTLTQYIPKMKGVRNWFATLSLGGIASTTWAAFNNLPPWAIFALGMLTMAVVIGFVFIVVKYRSNLFDLVKHVVTVNADPTTNNIELVSQK